jgi:hypothetical protein
MRGMAALAAIMALISPPRSASACQVLTYEASLQSSNIVFVGRLKSVSALPQNLSGAQPSNAIFEVTQVIKGQVPETVTIRDIGNNCYQMPQFSAELHKATEYLVFAQEFKGGSYATKHPLANTPLTDENGLGEFKQRALDFVKRQLDLAVKPE